MRRLTAIVVLVLLLTSVGCGYYGPPVRAHQPPPRSSETEPRLHTEEPEPEEEEQESPEP